MLSSKPLLIFSKELTYDVVEQFEFVTDNYQRQDGQPFSLKSLPNLVIQGRI